MKNNILPSITLIIILLITTSACKNNDRKTEIQISATAIPMDNRWDSMPQQALIDAYQNYQQISDSIMSEVIGLTEIEMTKEGLQSTLGNFSSNLIYQTATLLLNHPVDFSLINKGGIRNDLPKGNITKKDLVRTYSFDNKLVIVEIEGKYLRKMFQFFGKTIIHPIGGNLQLIFEDEKHFKEAFIQQEPLDDERVYTLITSDFVFNGGDGLTMLSNAKSHQTTDLLYRDAIQQIFQMNLAKGIALSATLDDRIIIINQ